MTEKLKQNNVAPARGISPSGANGRAADKLGAFVGKDRKTLEKMEAVVAAAEAEPEKYAELVVKMDKSGKVSAPYKRLQIMKQSEEIRREEPAIPSRGPYRVIVADPPWPAEPNKPVPEGRASSPTCRRDAPAAVAGRRPVKTPQSFR